MMPLKNQVLLTEKKGFVTIFNMSMSFNANMTRFQEEKSKS